MNTVTIVTIIIAMLSCAGVVTCLVFDLRIKKVKLYWGIGVCGALAALAVNHTKIVDIVGTLGRNTAVNPLKILTFFICMAILSVILDNLNVFEYIAVKCVLFAKNSQYKLFFTFYALVSALTVFTSNDIVILAFIPFICGFCKHAGLNPVPYVMETFVAANTWSMLLVFGNPTNVYLSAFARIRFGAYFLKMALPTLASAVVSLGVMLLLFRKFLHVGVGGTVESTVPPVDKPLAVTNAAFLAACTVTLAIAGYAGWEMWSVALGFALCTVVTDFIVCAVRKRNNRFLFRAFKRAPWEFVPFLIAMFLLVTCLDVNGVTARLTAWLDAGYNVFTYGVASFLCSNVTNNIPMTTLFACILQNATYVSADTFAVIVGSNIGALFTPIGALAGILFLQILRQKNVPFSVKSFILYGTAASLPALAAALGVLWLL